MSTTEQHHQRSARAEATSRLLVSVVIPCLNEAENIEALRRARRSRRWSAHGHRRRGASSPTTTPRTTAPRSPAAAGARVVHEPRRGYGSAYLAGFAAARGDYIVMADADLTYDFDEIPRFLAELEDGADLVMGDRMDNIQPGRDAVAAPLRRQPDPDAASSTSSSAPACSDAHCGMRARPPRRAAACSTCARPGWSSPPRWSSAPPRSGLDIRQFPIEYHPRGGESQARRASATAGATCASCSSTARTHLFILPGRR